MSRSLNTIEGSGAASGANARTTERAKYLRVSIASGRKLYVPSAFGAKSSIQLFVLATQMMPSFAHVSLMSRSLNVTVAAFVAVRR